MDPRGPEPMSFMIMGYLSEEPQKKPFPCLLPPKLS